MNIVSFEYILLEFKKLTDWVFAEDDDFRFQRSDLLKAREMLIDAINENKDYKSVPEIRKIFLQINEYNIEQFVSKLLYLITRNTGFEVTKGSLGILLENRLL